MDMRPYYCEKCGNWHVTNSKIAEKHRKFEGRDPSWKKKIPKGFEFSNTFAISHPERERKFREFWNQKGFDVFIRKNRGISAFEVYTKKKKKRHRGLFGEIAIPKTHEYEVIKAYGSLEVGRILNLPTNVDTSSLMRRGIVKPKRKKRGLDIWL